MISRVDHINKMRGNLLSIVIPVFNEREVLPECLARLQQVIRQLGMAVEIVFVDDGSCDGTGEYLIDAASHHQPVRLVRLSRNFGKEAALSAGLSYARGDAVVVMDADLQDPPELIPDMVSKWQQGADVVLMQRRTRQGEGWLKRSTAYGFYWLLQKLSRSPIPVNTGDFRLMSRRVVDALMELPERNRFMKGLFAWVGMPSVVIEYDRPERAAGDTKWNYPGLVRLAWEGITSFSTAPLRLATIVGLAAATIGGAYGLWIVAKTLVLGTSTPGFPSLIAVVTFLGGCQLLGIGIVGEYVGKTYLESKQRPLYLVRDVIGDPGVAAGELVRAMPGGNARV
ncbi:glycosyltransferase family 2 protein [Marinobacter lacisalsi]|uniref:Glycosyltransferase family 2 protein n=1 Tax=Marinobacter lacisalsi TaxID=475979 RepID=A0ABV8QJD2_9GAMM